MPLSFSLADQRDWARLLTSDTSAVKPGLDDNQWNAFMDDALYQYAAHAEGDETVFGFDTFTINSGQNTAVLAFTDVPLNIEAVYLSVASPEAKLVKKALPVIIAQQLYDPDNTDRPRFYSYDARGGRDEWTLYFDKKANQNYEGVAWYRREPIPYGGDDAALTPYGDTAARTIATMAAARAAATVLGRTAQTVTNIEKFLPKWFELAALVAGRSVTHGGTLPGREP